ncbi:hypothetical protein VXI92_004944 [Enterobacter hormaechei]|uniref:Uncharacterized protein n=4 Tax=Enterobacter cloacae complex TaxID=354276 RepID=A0AAE8X4Z4_9ENTR|nr:MULTISPECIES: hypothetical protein [Enterobacter]EHF4934771.1 hypothetical protein [Enterobacter hormaechei]EHF4937984.1 hypothetical protein [Enterobacter hormaechei]EHN8795895.1 hypothetical protein [Enterobacter hormaechei]EHN8799024.1 hypothetical protein [Enterobacter hormaechei]EHN8840220.1 hypothetical protein [Enterobacter hormaechei]
MMTLLELLVKELPSRGGWPDGVERLEQYPDGALFDGPNYQSNFKFQRADDFGDDEVTREQYEAALVASKPEWDGEGLPPVGCECEYETKFDGWQPVRIELIKSEGIAFTWLSNSQAYNGLDCVGVQKSGSFRPIRSEADKRRHETMRQLSHSLRANGSVTEEQLNRLYADVAAGKIPHIRID